MLPISTLGFISRQTVAFTNTRSLSEDLAHQLSTGLKAVDLADNPDRLRILDLRTTKSNRESYLTSIDIATTTVDANKVALDHLKQVVKDVLDNVRKVSANTSALDPTQPNFDPEQQFAQLSSFINAAMADVTVTMNERVGDSFLFSGSRVSLPYATPPVADLTNKALVPDFTTAYPLPAVQVDDPTSLIPLDIRPATFTAPSGYAGVGPNDATGNPVVQLLPIYDSDANTADPAGLQTVVQQAWLSPNATIDDNQTVSYKFTSVDATFQHLMNGLRAARTATDHASPSSTPAGEQLSVADRNAYFALAVSSLDKALNGDPNNAAIAPPMPSTLGLTGMIVKNDLAQLTLSSKETFHKDQISLLTTKLERLEGIDSADVTAKLAAANNQLEASYQATSSLLHLSLLNYLK
ncbi:MAG: hypothetical protein GC191_17870 [Azospirillum sp.]|nr:hypothetical protein [Azospirillum sp.]